MATIPQREHIYRIRSLRQLTTLPEESQTRRCGVDRDWFTGSLMTPRPTDTLFLKCGRFLLTQVDPGNQQIPGHESSHRSMSFPTPTFSNKTSGSRQPGGIDSIQGSGIHCAQIWCRAGKRIRLMAYDRISADARRMNGQPCIRNKRLTVRRVVQLVALYPDRLELQREYPELEDEDIRQSLEYAASRLEDGGTELNLCEEVPA